MPYSIARGKGCSPSKPWAVVKDTDGSVVACHASKESALAQIRALYAAEPALAKARLGKHLSGQHDQAAHSGKGSPTLEGYVRDSVRTNMALRRGETPDAALEMDALMASSVLADRTQVYRVVEFPPGDKTGAQLRGLKKGDTFTDKAFQSTSEDLDTAQDFAVMGYKNKVVMTIRAGAGTHAIKVPAAVAEKVGMGDQFEVIIDRGATMRVVRRTEMDDGSLALDLEVLTTNQSAGDVTKHLPGQHQQQAHGQGGGPSTPATDKPKRPKRTKEQIAADDEKAWALHEQGKSWDQVASELGYANGGVARRSGMRHAERAAGGGKPPTPKKPDTPDTPDTPDKPEVVDVVDPPRPMVATDPSQGLTPVKTLEEAQATGRPLEGLTREGTSKAILDREQEVLANDAERSRLIEKHRDKIEARRAERQAAIDAHNAGLAEQRRLSPQKEGEPNYAYESRIQREAYDAKRTKDLYPPRPEDDAGHLGSIALSLTGADKAEYDAFVESASGQWDRLRDTVRHDTVEQLYGWRYERRPYMVTDWDAPVDPVTGKRPMKQEVNFRGEPQFEQVYVKPDGSAVSTNEVWRNTDKGKTGYEVVQQTANYRFDRSAQQITRERLRREDPEGFGRAETEQLRRQQDIVDSPHTRIVIHAPVSAVGGIVTSGRFKSQLETGRGTAFKGRETREGFEAATMGIVHGDDKSKAPIYGALHVGGVRPPEAVGAELYGPVGFVLRRSVHERSTFTDGDSLGLCHEPSPLTGRQTRPNGHSVNGGVDVINGRRSAEQHASDISPSPRKSKPYHEAQVTGGVTLADVEYITVPKGTKLPAATEKKLRAAGVKIVEYDIAEIGPPVTGSTEYYPDKKKPFSMPTYADGDWANIPAPADKRRWTMAVDLRKWFRRTDILEEPPAVARKATKGFDPNVTIKHLAGKHDQRTHGSGGHGHSGDLQAVADKIKEKTAALEASGGEIFAASDEDIEMAKESVETIAGMMDTSIDDDPGLQMTQNALEPSSYTPGIPQQVLIATEGDTGSVAGAIRVEHTPAYGISEKKAETVDDPVDALVELPPVTTIAYLGTTGTADGAGSALFGAALKVAAKRKEGMVLEPLDEQAESFWKAMGFTDRIKVGKEMILLEGGLILSAEAVADLAGAL